MPLVNPNKHLQFSRGMHMTAQIINRLVTNQCLEVGTSSCKMSNFCCQKLCLHTGLNCTCRQCFSFYEGSSLRAWRIQQFSRFRVEITNFQSSKGRVVAWRSLLPSKNFIIPTESLNFLLLLGYLPSLEIAVTCGNRKY